jgi:hypothetical protein
LLHGLKNIFSTGSSCRHDDTTCKTYACNETYQDAFLVQ